MPTRHHRRWFQFSIGALLLLVTLVGLFMGWRVNRLRYRPKPFPPPTPAEIQALVAHVNGPAKPVGFIKNIQVPAANRLGDAGEVTKPYGAVQALTALIANTKDPEAKKAAEQALRKINGPGP